MERFKDKHPGLQGFTLRSADTLPDRGLTVAELTGQQLQKEVAVDAVVNLAVTAALGDPEAAQHFAESQPPAAA